MTKYLTFSDGVDVTVVGRNALGREGLRRILADQGFNVRAVQLEETCFNNLSEIGAPHLMIVDAPSAEEGIDICTLLRNAHPDMRLVMIAETHDLETVCRAYAAGVDGYFVKAIACEALVGALKLILLGEKVVPSQTLTALASIRQPAERHEKIEPPAEVDLTDREVEILGRLVHGEANKIISRRLMITEATVKVHVKAILRKLRVMNRTQAAIWAVNRGLFPLEDARFSQAS